MSALRLKSRSPRSLRCSYCRAGLDHDALRCPDCGVRVHADCQRELDLCPTLGCGSLAPWEPGAPAQRAPRWRRVAAAIAAAVLVGCGSLLFGPGMRPAAEETPPVARAARRGQRRARIVLATGATGWVRATRCYVRSDAPEPSTGRRGRVAPLREPPTEDEPAPTVADDPWSVAHGPVQTHEFRARWPGDGPAEVWLHPAQRGEAPEWLRSGRSWTPLPGATLEEERPTLVTVPAGTFPSTYRRERRVRGHGAGPGVTELVETWADPSLPAPYLRVETSWTDAPDRPTRRKAVLVSIEE